jgi:hypothetical protein
LLRSVEDDLAAIDFDALRMRRMMSEDDIGTGIDQVVGKCAVLRADLSRARGGPMDRDLLLSRVASGARALIGGHQIAAQHSHEALYFKNRANGSIRPGDRRLS